MKKLLTFLAGAQLLISSCGNPIPEEVADAATKEYWQGLISDCKCPDDAGIKEKMQDILQDGRLIVVSTDDVDYSGKFGSYQVLEGAVVNSDNDTVADVFVMREWGEFNEQHRTETGIEAFISKTARFTINNPATDMRVSLISQENNDFPCDSMPSQLIKTTSSCRID